MIYWTIFRSYIVIEVKMRGAYAFVTMEDRKEAEAAIRNKDGEDFRDKRLSWRRLEGRSQRRGATSAKEKAKKSKEKAEKAMEEAKEAKQKLVRTEERLSRTDQKLAKAEAGQH